MLKKIRNLLKQKGLFKCRHPAHRQFQYEISPYHVIVEKGCYPEGCVEFLWKCHDLDKGKKCPKNFKHVGRGCFSCKKFYDEKMTYRPETDLDGKSLKRFMDDLLEYRGWLDSMRGKNVRFGGTVASVFPHLKMAIDNGQGRVYMDGFYISFDSGYFDNNLFDDKIYLRVNGRFLCRTEATPGDDLEFDAIFTEDRGRIILRNPKKIEMTKNGGKECINISRAQVARATGKIIVGSIEKCEDCSYCSLIDIEDRSRKEISHYRRFYCLRGISDSDNCPARIEEIIRAEKRKIRF
ncbi:MAG: hypothetical protein JSU85_12865 [Candidatus Zixiibacteriota bacterium]|nr:MAG: hypothetical protein JSU85_12865 [candidate division Zixibacteria bacterium]